ncbi:MAG TPA: hypothetical protein VF524_01290 [Polyangia bacterium]
MAGGLPPVGQSAKSFISNQGWHRRARRQTALVRRARRPRGQLAHHRPDDAIYVGSDDGKLYALRAK